ncbi:MAG: hypothetical protein JXA73_26900 [Acidobacteria bacterium]|nr:hypothetical protein [Acidobacteriota bacterium]
MSDDFGLLNPVVSPFLERVVREEQLSGDQPRKQRYLRPKSARKTEDSASPDESEEAHDSMSSTHIDLRI